MIPILFEHDAKTFTGHGLGDLIDAISCIVKQTDTSEFELEMKYPIDGYLASELIANRIIYAKVNNSKYEVEFTYSGTSAKKQAFRIYAIEKELSGYVTVKAQHISYDLMQVYLAPLSDWPTGYYGTPIIHLSASSPDEIIQWINNSSYICLGTNEFTITSSGYGPETWRDEYVTAYEPRSIRSLLFDSNNSLIANFGGVCAFDNFNIRFIRNPSNTISAHIDYGDDLIDLSQENNISEMITGILPYCIGKDFVYFDDDSYSGTESIVFGDIVYAEGSFERQRIVPVDLSSYFNVNKNDPMDNKWSNLIYEQWNGKYIYKPDINGIARQYAKTIELGVPDINITVDHVNTINSISLYDLVRVHFNKLGIDINARVVTTEYDVLNERNTKIEIGKSKASRNYNNSGLFGNEYTGKYRITS